MEIPMNLTRDENTKKATSTNHTLYIYNLNIQEILVPIALIIFGPTETKGNKQ